MRNPFTFTPRAALLLIILICLVGALLRLWSLGANSLWIDEGYTINTANGILKYGVPVLDSGKWVENGILSNYAVAGVLALVPLDPFSPWAARLPAALAGIGIIAATYALARRLFGGYFIALVSAGLMALMSWEIAWSQQSRGYTMLTLFLLLAALFLWRFLQDRRRRDLAFGMAVFVLAMWSHFVALAFRPAFVFFAVAYREAGQWRRMRTTRALLLAAAIGAATWLGLTIATRVSPMELLGYIPYYARFLFLHGPVVFTIAAASGIVLGCFDRRRGWPVAFLSTTVLLSTLLIIGYSRQAQFRYLFPLIPFFAITGVYAAVRIAELALPFIPVWSRHAAAGTAFTVLCVPMLTFIPKEYYALELGSPQPAFNVVYTFLKPLVMPEDIVLSAYPHLNRIYLNNDGMWLAMPLGGRWSEITEWIKRDRDRYTDAPAIVETREFDELFRSGRGFVIIDHMTRVRRPDVELLLRSRRNTALVFEIRTSLDEVTRVYQFRQQPR